jgi:hypothetical protein
MLPVKRVSQCSHVCHAILPRVSISAAFDWQVTWAISACPWHLHPVRIRGGAPKPQMRQTPSAIRKKEEKKARSSPLVGKGTQTRSTARMGAGASTRHAGFVEPESYKEHGTAEAAAREKVRKRSILAPCLRCKLSASVAGVVCRHLRMHARSTTERLQLLPILARLRPPMRTMIKIGLGPPA